MKAFMGKIKSRSAERLAAITPAIEALAENDTVRSVELNWVVVEANDLEEIMPVLTFTKYKKGSLLNE